MVEFLGEVECVSDVQKEFIRSVLEEKGFKDKKVSIEAVGQKGDNYGSHIKRLKVVDDTFSLIAKIAPARPLTKDTMEPELSFVNESLMYKEYLPKIVKIQRDFGVPEDQLFRYPKFYGSVDEAPYEMILLEDLKPLGYAILDRFKTVPNEAVKLVMKNLAIHHSVSFAIKRNEPEEFDYFSKKLLNQWVSIIEKKEMKPHVMKVADDLVDILHEDKSKSAVPGLVCSMLEYNVLHGTKALESPQSVIVQGDCWINNVMYKFKDGVPESCILIDYQISKVGFPVDDLLFFILCCTDYDARSKHFDEWKDYYHNELGAALSNYDMKIDEVYPKEVFEDQSKMYGRFSLTLSLLVAGILVREPKDTINAEDYENMKSEDVLEETRVIHLDEVTKKRLREKMEGILKSAFEYGIISHS